MHEADFPTVPFNIRVYLQPDRDLCKLQSQPITRFRRVPDWSQLDRRTLTSIETVLGLIDGTSLVAASLVLFYLVARTKLPSLRVLSLLLGLFALAHGMYHLMFTLVIGYAARAALDTLSVVFLLSFAIYYTKRGNLA